MDVYCGLFETELSFSRPVEEDYTSRFSAPLKEL